MADSRPGVVGEFLPGLVRVLSVLEPHLDRVVLVGGWVPYLMASVRSGPAAGEPLLTRDIDIAVPRRLGVVGDDIDQLLRGSGLEYSFRSLFDPPVVSFVGVLDGCEVEIEFLTHESGGEERVMDVGGGLHAQSLHYVSILLENTVRIPVQAADGHALSVSVPTPAAFVLNKGLTFPQRKSSLKKAKDLYYLFSVLDAHADSFSEIVDGIARVGARHPKAWLKRFIANIEGHFEDSEAEGVRLAVSQRPSRAFVDLDDDQFAQYVLRTFRVMLSRLSGLSRREDHLL